MSARSRLRHPAMRTPQWHSVRDLKILSTLDSPADITSQEASVVNKLGATTRSNNQLMSTSTSHGTLSLRHSGEMKLRQLSPRQVSCPRVLHTPPTADYHVVTTCHSHCLLHNYFFDTSTSNFRTSIHLTFNDLNSLTLTTSSLNASLVKRGRFPFLKQGDANTGQNSQYYRRLFPTKFISLPSTLGRSTQGERMLDFRFPLTFLEPGFDRLIAELHTRGPYHHQDGPMKGLPAQGLPPKIEPGSATDRAVSPLPPSCKERSICQFRPADVTSRPRVDFKVSSEIGNMAIIQMEVSSATFG